MQRSRSIGRPQYLALNPHGKVPALMDGNQTFFESGAILLHLGTKYGVEKNLFPAGGGQARADAISWTVWAVAELGPYMMQYLYHGLDTPVSYKKEDRSKAAGEYSLTQFNRQLDVLEARLANQEYLLGTFSLVDVAAASWLAHGHDVRPETRTRAMPRVAGVKRALRGGQARPGDLDGRIDG